jgi:hypothetical protein
MFGFLILWVLLVILGTFLRGPNWNIFGPYEYWDIHKLEALVNVNLSEFIWVKGLHMKLPANMLVREIFGILAVLFYLMALPAILAKTFLKKYYVKLGPWRYAVFVMLFLGMVALPIKMILRWTITLKYIVSMPEIFFNI